MCVQYILYLLVTETGEYTMIDQSYITNGDIGEDTVDVELQ